MSLPAASHDQPYMLVSALKRGFVDAPIGYFVKGEDRRVTVPALAFALRHSQTSERIVFDLGIRKDSSTCPPAVQKRMKDVLPVFVPQDVGDSLRNGGVPPEDIRTIILSHIHWGHIGDSSHFPNARFIVGEGTRTLLRDGYPANADALYHQTNTIPVDRTTFLPPSVFNHALGPFPRAYDYFGDGSMFVIDAPGHLPSHINLLVRTDPHGSWLYLAGDSAHDLCCLTGEKELGEQAQSDYGAAVNHAHRVGKLLRLSEVRVILAHDFTWFAENEDKDVWFPGTIPP